MPVRDESHMQQQRKRITDAAFRCFSTLGYQKTSIRAICKESGLSVGAIYTHFKDRNEILLSMTAVAYEMPLEDLSVDSWEEFSGHLYSALNLDEHPENLDYVVCDVKLMSESLSNDQLAAITGKIRAASYDWTRRTLERLRDAQQIELPLGVEATTRAIRYLITGASMSVATGDTNERACAAGTLEQALNALVIRRSERRDTNAA